MGVSMSAVTPINRNAAVIGEEYLGVSPPAAGSSRDAAAADHLHRVRTSSSSITGFGRMAQYVFEGMPSATALAPSWGYLFAQKALSVPKEWTAEGYLTQNPAPANPVLNVLLGWAEPDGEVPYNNAGAAQSSNAQNFMGLSFSSTDTVVWGGSQLGFPNQDSPGLAATHVFVQMDSSGNIWMGVNGTLQGPFAPPAGSVIYQTAFPFLAIGPNQYGDPETWDVDEIRFSSVLRYPTSGTTYAVPDGPFNPDSSTILLWHLDDVPYGQFEATTGDGAGVYVFGPTTADATLNAVTGIFAIQDTTGASTGVPPPMVWQGTNSNVLPDSGSGRSATVESIQGQTGNFLLVDAGGNVLPVDSPSGAQQIQVVGHLFGSPEYWY
jgi:hypothetical protein